MADMFHVFVKGERCFGCKFYSSVINFRRTSCANVRFGACISRRVSKTLAGLFGSRSKKTPGMSGLELQGLLLDGEVELPPSNRRTQSPR